MKLLVDVVLPRRFRNVVLLAFSTPQRVDLVDLARDRAALFKVVRFEHLAESPATQQRLQDVALVEFFSLTVAVEEVWLW